MKRSAAAKYHASSKSDKNLDTTYDPECILLLRKLFGETLAAKEELALDQYLFLQRYPLQ